jgi:hypothetical protein
MRRDMRLTLRRSIALILIVFMAAGCSKPVEIPHDQFESAAREEHARHRIQKIDGSHYTVERFSLTDSTVVIEKLNRTDARYKRTALPIVVPLSDVESISKYELDKDRSFFALVGAGAVALLVIAMATLSLPFD